MHHRNLISSGDVSTGPARSTGRARWAAIGAATAITLGAGGLMSASAAVDSGERATYVPITPCRIMDTRVAPETVGPRATPIGADETYAISVLGANGNCTIPADAVGLVMNVAAVNPTAGSFLTVFPSDAAKPLAANLNWSAGQPPVSNAVTADISADGKVSFYNLGGTVDVTSDIVGYYVDHNHDDRYYTETESDTALAAKQNKPVGPQILHVDAAAFVPMLAGTAYSLANGDLRGAGVPFEATAPVQLPEGAIVTKVSARVFDSDAVLNTSIEMVANPSGAGVSAQMAIASTNGQPGQATITDNSTLLGVVQNGLFTYRLNTFSIDENTRLYDVEITYIMG